MFAPDMLLAGLQRQHVTTPALGIDRRPDQPPGHAPHQRLGAGDEPDVGPAERERNAQRLSVAHGEVGAVLAGRREDPE